MVYGKNNIRPSKGQVKNGFQQPGQKTVQLQKICTPAARLAPSACNAQPWRFVVLDKKEIKDSVAKAATSGVYLLDMGISCQNLVLQATEEGLGSCYIGLFSEKKVKKALNIPKKTSLNFSAFFVF